MQVGRTYVSGLTEGNKVTPGWLD